MGLRAGRVSQASLAEDLLGHVQPSSWAGMWSRRGAQVPLPAFPKPQRPEAFLKPLRGRRPGASPAGCRAPPTQRQNLLPAPPSTDPPSVWTRPLSVSMACPAHHPPNLHDGPQFIPPIPSGHFPCPSLTGIQV